MEQTSFSTAVLYDAARRLGLDVGLRGVRPIRERFRVASRAYTVKFAPADQPPKTRLNFYDIIDGAPKDHVLVFGVGVDRWIFGGNVSRFAEMAGVPGLILDGCVRDIAEIRERGFPIFTSGVSVSGYQSERILSAVGEDIVCGGIPVATGDLVVGDDDGVVCLPALRVDEILFEAEEIASLDERLAGDIEKGRPLEELRATGSRWPIRRALT